MTNRYLWTLERHGRPALSDLDTAEDLNSTLHSQNLYGIMPADWVFATLHFDAGRSGVAVHGSMLGLDPDRQTPAIPPIAAWGTN